MSQTNFTLELYKTKIDTATLNQSILNIIELLEKYEASYVDNFPISIDPFEFTISDDALSQWKKSNKINENATPEEAFEFYKNKYKIEQDDIYQARKIMAIRYEIEKTGYSSTRALTISQEIPREAVSEFSESSEKFPGISINTMPVRKYTSGTLASHILGYVGKINPDEYEKRKDTYRSTDLIGRAGVESVFEEYLKGKNGTKQIDMAVDGGITAEYISEEAISGSDIVLTIDANLQRVTEEALKSNIQKIANGGFGRSYETNAGACVVMNVNSGEVLAMASYPDYNPEDFVGGISNEKWDEYRLNESKPLVNKAVQNSYSPGSTFKMITAISGLESGVINTSTRINDTGVYRKYGISKNCWYYTDYHTGHGPLNVAGAIEKSCNFFFYETGDRMGIDTLDRYATYFGLGTKTGIELLGETTGVLASKEAKARLHIDEPTFTQGDMLNVAIGQGDNEFSPLQMAKYISMLANGGRKIDVSLIKTIRNADGTEVSRDTLNNFINQKLGLGNEETEDLEINQANLTPILEGMRSVTADSGGTAYVRFKDFNVEVGGKTGSAEAPNNKVHAWFVGFAPFDNPEIAIVVMVENGGHGNYTAEVVRDIMQEYFGMNTEDVYEDMTARPYTQIMR